MTARKRKDLGAVPCALSVSRGGVSVGVENVALRDAVDLACYLLDRFNAQQALHPEFAPPEGEPTQFGGYTPVHVTGEDDGATKKRKSVGF